GVVPAAGFSFSAQQIWRVIKENKDLDLPAHKVMVATVRCEEIANEKLHHLSSNEDWLALEEAVQCGPVSGFGRRLSSILETYFSEYDIETFYFDHGVRNAKRKQLESKALDFVHPAYLNLLGHFCFKALEDFKSRLEQMLNKGEGFAASICTSTESCMLEFDQGCAVHFFLIDAAIKQANWDASKVKEKLHRDINAHALSVQDAKLSELMVSYEKQLGQSLSEPVESLFDNAGRDTWASIRKLLTRSQLSSVMTMIQCQEFGLERKTLRQLLRVLSLSLLSVMVAIRLDGKPDEIENILFSSLMEGTVTAEAYKQSNNWLPPPWAIVAMVVLGFNEFMLLLRNPLCLMGLFVVYLLSKAMWVQMDIPGQFQHGTLAGLISISSRFLPTIMNLLRRLAEEAQGHQTDEPPQATMFTRFSEFEESKSSESNQLNSRVICSI
ncbi:hypothetical protein Gohar_003041, partial [Gossypium harknessii]|nr:hypothetical protein [Gossypium harknessii]